MKKKRYIIIALILSAAAIIYSAAAFTAPYNGPTLDEFFRSARDPDVENILSDMTLEEKTGQMFMGCFYNGTPSAETVNEYHLGSVLLFGTSFDKTDRHELSARLDALADTDCPPVIAVDEEGGTVTRVSGNPGFRKKAFRSPRALYKKGGIDAIVAETHEKNALLSSLGIQLNLAPVCDITSDPDDFMYSRSLGQNAQITSEFAARVTEACISDGIACALKHFPGYGNTSDTHKGLAVDNRSSETIINNDLKPFEAGIQAGAPMVLVSHNIVTSIDKTLPSSLSPACHKLLIQDLNFDGIIITDDLSMGAISNYMSPEKSALAAVMAGNDMLCTGNYKKQYEAVLNAVNNGIISEDRIDRSVRKILKLKIELGLIDTGTSAVTADIPAYTKEMKQQ
ncbi:MAG: glycoside hydrolase family 3 N-terminal domain-containing protein [Firmicutes bacterium]|nr:glycoside hydrolase family 3 N-terminal domain-containing protein [Bacillota bacterium]